jgi:hypothetical protein
MGNPFGARSISEFWGSRWNSFVGTSIRYTVFKPLQSLLIHPLIASTAAFFVSAILHEYLLWSTRCKATGENTLFFVLQALIGFVDVLIVKAFKGRYSWVDGLRRVILFGGLILTAPLFLNPFTRCGLFTEVFKVPTFV